MQDPSEPMFCFETAFKLLTLSWAAYEDEEPPVSYGTLCMLQKLNAGDSNDHSPEGTPRLGGECRCSHGLSSLKEVCTVRLQSLNHYDRCHNRAENLASGHTFGLLVAVRSACKPAEVQDKMEMGVLKAETSRKQRVARMDLGASLAMLGLQHAHVIHEADPDTKVECVTLTIQSWPRLEQSFCVGGLCYVLQRKEVTEQCTALAGR